MSFSQSHPPRRGRSFHAQTRDRRPANFGFRIWPRKCNPHATGEICARFRCNLRVERPCSEQESRSGSRAFCLQKRRTEVRTGLPLPLRSEFALTRATTIQFSLDFRFGNFDARRATIDHHADAAAMGLAKCGDAEQLAKCVAHRSRKLNKTSPNVQAWRQRRRTATGSCHLDRFQRALQIIDQVADVLDAHRQPDERIGDAELCRCSFGTEACVISAG